MRDLIVDGVPLRDPLGEWFIDYTQSKMATELSRAIVADSQYGYHGEVATTMEDAYFGTGRESWVLNVTADTGATHNLYLRSLIALMQRPVLNVVSAPQRTALNGGTARGGQTFSTAVVGAGAIWVGRFRLVGSPAIDRINETTSRVTFVVENLDAFWKSNDYFTSTLATITAATQTLTLDSTLSGATSVIMDGLVRIRGPLTSAGSVIIRDRNNAFRSVGFAAGGVALASGSYVIIDITTLKARLQTSDTWAMTGGTDVTNKVVGTSEGSFFLSPEPGSGFPSGAWSIFGTVLSAGYTSGTTAIEVRARKAYQA